MPNDLDAGLDRIESRAAFRLTQPCRASDTVAEALRELRKILHDLEGGDWKEGPVRQEESGAAFRDARMTAGAEPMHGKPEAPVTPAAASGKAVAIYAPAAAPENPPRRRNGMALATLATAGLAVLGATGLGVARRPVLPYLTASTAAPRHARLDDGAAVMARAALPPRLIPAVARPSAPAAPRPVAATRDGTPSGGNVVPAAFQPSQAPPRPASALRMAPVSPVAAAPHKIGTALSLPPRPAPAQAVSSQPVLPAHAQSAAERLAGEGLRKAGDVRIVEGDIASARLFYERAADAGDAQAALDLGNSFNSAFLKRLGVLGIQGDVAAAALWYRRARMLGDPDAGRALKTLIR